MAEVAPAPAAVPAKASKRKAVRPRSSSPTLGVLIVKVVSASKERSGVSLAALKKTLVAEGHDIEKNKSRVKLAVTALESKGTLVQTKRTGASGSFKMSKKTTEPKAKKPVKKDASKAKKPAVKKSTAPKKTKAAVKANKPAPADKSPKKGKKVAATKKSVKSPKKGNKSPQKRPRSPPEDHQA